jgi:hypothetical protein
MAKTAIKADSGGGHRDHMGTADLDGIRNAGVAGWSFPGGHQRGEGELLACARTAQANDRCLAVLGRSSVALGA